MIRFSVRLRYLLLLFAAAGSPFLPAFAQQVSPSGAAAKGNTPQESPARALRNFERLPLSFEANQGQTDSKVKFVARGRGYELYLAPGETLLALKKARLSGSAWSETDALEIIRMNLIGANASPEIVGVHPIPGTINYLLGNNPADWKKGVQAFAEVKYAEVYPGIDLIFHGNQRRLEYDLVVAPGANPEDVRMAFRGVESVELGREGNLLLHAKGGTLELQKPAIYQESNGSRETIPGGYVLGTKQGEVGFQISAYNTSKPLVIDPVLVYSTYLGGIDNDAGTGIAVDSAGNTYVTGFTSSSNFPVMAAPGTAVLKGTVGGTSDGFVTKFDPTGKLIYSTYLGGSDNDSATSIAVDAQGNAYLTGGTISFDFPVVNGFQSTLLPGGIFKSANAGSTWSPSGVNSQSIVAMAISPVHTMVYAGTTAGVFRTTNSGTTWTATNLTSLMNTNALVVDPVTTSTVYAGTTLAGIFKSIDSGATWSLASTGLPNTSGIFFNQVTALAIDPGTPSTLYAGITGNGLFKSIDGGATWNQTTLTNLPSALAVDPLTPSTVYAATSQGIFKSLNGGATWALTAFTTSVNSLAVHPTSTSTIYAGTNAGLVVSTDGGATWNPSGLSGSVGPIQIDRVNAGTLYATAGGIVEKSTDGGTTWNVINSGLTQPAVNVLALDSFTNKIAPVLYAGTNATNPEAFVAKLDPTGTQLLYSTYLGGTGRDEGLGIAVDTSGNAYVTGSTGSHDWPTTPGALQTSFRSTFVTKLNTTASGPSSLVYSTFLGGTLNSANDLAVGIAVDPLGDAYVAGRTSSTNFPTTSGAFSPTCGTDGNCNNHQLDAFVAELNPAGSGLAYATYLGGSGSDTVRGIAVDSSGNIYVVGDTSSSDFPTVNAFQTAPGSGQNVFIAKLNPNLSGVASLIYSTYLGGSGDDFGGAITADNSGLAYATGNTNSTNFPLASPTQGTFDPGVCLNGCSDAFVTILNTNATGPASLAFSTYLGGSAPDAGTAIAVDSVGSVYITGTTQQPLAGATPFPSTPGTLQNTYNGGIQDAFVTKIASAGLSIFMTPSANSVTRGNNLTYTITVTTIGQNTFTGITVTDVLPAGLTFVSASATCAGTTTVTCSLGSMAGDTSKQISIVVTATGAGQVSNTATVTANEPNPTPSAATTTALITIITNADLSLTLTGSSPTLAVSGLFADGGNLTYTIIVFNHGPDPAANVTVTHTISPFLTLNGAPSTSRGACTFTSQTILTCNLGMMANNDFATITMSGVASFQALGAMASSASVTAANVNDPVISNNSASVATTAITRSSDLNAFTIGQTLGTPGGPIVFKIIVSDLGPDAAGGVHLLDSIDTADLNFVSATSTAGTCSFDGTGTVDCDLAVITPSIPVTVTINATVKLGFQVTPTSRVNNTARVDFTDLLGGNPDPNTSDNTTTISTPIALPTVDLSISQVTTGTPATVGDPFTYTLIVMDPQIDDAPNVVVTDDLPAEVTLVSVTPTQGTCVVTGVASIRCNLGTIPVGGTASIAVAVTPNSTGHISNTAFVMSGGREINSTDNQFTNITDFVFSTAEFATWEMTHCPPFVSSSAPFPPHNLNVAYVPTKFSDSPNILTMSQVVTRTRYIRDYYFQQSGCSIVVNPTVITDLFSSDGWFTFPLSLAQYGIPPAGGDPAGQLPYNVRLWTDGFDQASVLSPALLVGQQTNFFDAIMVIETTSRTALRGRAVMMRPLDNNPLVQGLIAGLKGADVGTVGAALTALGPLALALPLVTNVTPAELLTFPEIFNQGSIVISDEDDNVTWTHELGHALFGFFDYYGEMGNFFNRGDINACCGTAWGLMGAGQGSTPGSPGGTIVGAVPDYPVNSFHKVIAGWLNYQDICSTCFGDFPLKPLKDTPFGGAVLRYQTPRDLLGNPKGQVASYIFELREPPDDIPVTPERVGAPPSGPQFGQTGVVMYQKRDVHTVFGVPTYNPACGGAHGFSQDVIGALIGLEFSSCIEKVNTTDPSSFTLMPGQSFVDDMINKTFVLNSDMTNPTLTIHSTAFSRTVVQAELVVNTPTGQIDLPDSVRTAMGRVDLHVYASDGSHVGPNYNTGQFENGIAQAREGGVYTPSQWISIPDGVSASYAIDASQAVAAAQSLGVTDYSIDATAQIFRYDANGVAGKVADPVHFTLDLNHATTAQIPIALGANLGLVQDNTAPIVTPPAPIVVTATGTGGALVSASQALATFLASATAVDDVDVSPLMLLPQVGGVNVSMSTLFSPGVTTVTFRFQDASGKIGTANSTVTITSSPSVSIIAPGVSYGTSVAASVSVTSTNGTVTGSVMFSVDGGTAHTAALSNSAAVFNLGVLSAGTHSLSATFPAQGAFLVAAATGSVTVAPVPLTVTAASASRAYGAANPPFTSSFSGFVHQEGPTVLGGSLNCATAAVATSPIGAFPITCSGLTSSNYVISYAPGTLTVARAFVTITANNVTKNFGAANPTLTFTATGFANNETQAVLNHLPVCTTTATAASPVGTYPITCSGAVAADYSFTYVPGILTVSCHYVTIGLSPSTVALGGSVNVTGTLVSCATSTQAISVQFVLSGPLTPGSCSKGETEMFRTLPFPLPPKTQQSVSFPFRIPKGACAGAYTITANTFMNNKIIDTSTTTLTVTAH